MQVSPTPAGDEPRAIDPDFRIELPNFEGPLDLLLHLIRTHELDILDLPIAFITEKYLEYLGLMEQLNLDVASEYLLMAATLAHIKSKTLLPRPPEDQDDEAEADIDPRAELIRRLLEYQKYKRVAEDLGGRSIAGRDVFTRGTAAPQATGSASLAQVSVFKLIEALQKVAERARADLSLEVDAERITIQDRMNQVIDMLRNKQTCRFEELFEGITSTYDLVVTFLALLEMARIHIARIYQTDLEAPIHVEYRLLDEHGQPLVPADLQQPTAMPKPDEVEAPRESVVVPKTKKDQYP